MRAFLKTIFIATILAVIIAVPAAYFFVNDFVLPKVTEALTQVEQFEETIQEQSRLIQELIEKSRSF